MKANTTLEGKFVRLANIYTGASRSGLVLAVSRSGKKVTISRNEWKTGIAEFWYQPSLDLYKNEYSGEVFKLGINKVEE